MNPNKLLKAIFYFTLATLFISGNNLFASETLRVGVFNFSPIYCPDSGCSEGITEISENLKNSIVENLILKLSPKNIEIVPIQISALSKSTTGSRYYNKVNYYGSIHYLQIALRPLLCLLKFHQLE